MLFVFPLDRLMSLICFGKTSSYFHHDQHLSLDLIFMALRLVILVVRIEDF